MTEPRSGLRLHDSLSRTTRPFVPLRPGHVGIYVCGATPQDSPHLGHTRSQVAFDVLRRWLLHAGYEVTMVRNVTDIDDKMLARSAEAGVPWWAHAYRHEREFDEAYAALRVLPPTHEPRATGHVTEMVELMERLVTAGHAYVVPWEASGGVPGSADVYFDVRSFGPYGELTRQQLGDLEPAEDTDPAAAGCKRDPRDFALWKGTKPGEPATASWPTPWGRGRPGWHLECSAMATRYLGSAFDIHGGGLDLRFPHHENELAQSRAAGDGFAQTWLHNALLTTAGEKMSKSLGNTLGVRHLLRTYRAEALRYYLVSAHYRSALEISPTALDDAAAAWQRIASFLQRAAERLGADALASGTGHPAPPAATGDPTSAAALRPPAGGELPEGFTAAMDDDLATPAAVAVLHATVRDGNTALDAGDDTALASAARAVTAMARVLGIEPAAESGTDRASAALDALVRAELDVRAHARATRDFAAADAIRDRLAAAGVVVEDTPDGARWSLGSTAGVLPAGEGSPAGPAGAPSPRPATPPATPASPAVAAGTG